MNFNYYLYNDILIYIYIFYLNKKKKYIKKNNKKNL